MKGNKEQGDIIDISLSEKDDKGFNPDNGNNSIFDKSLQSGDVTFPELIENKEFLQVKLNELNSHVFLASKSIKNIFLKMSDKENLENNYFDYIVCLVSNDTEKEETITEQEPTFSNFGLSLDPIYAELLNKTQNYYISLTKKKNKRITLKNDSLSKIFKFLNADILQMNDYIEVVIFSYDGSEYDSIEKGILLRTKLLKKSSQSSNYGEEKTFDGYRKLSMVQNQANKTKKNNIEKLNRYFEKVLIYIENKDMTPLGKNNLIGFNNNNDDEYGVHLIPNCRTDELRSIDGDNVNDLKKQERTSTENCCYDVVPCAEPCATICSVF